MIKTANLTTGQLDVPPVEVVDTVPEGAKAFAGPFYADQLDLLRDMLRDQSKREAFVVVTSDASNWIYRRP